MPKRADGPEHPRYMFEHSSDGILLLGDQGRTILHANPKACLLLGKDEKDIIGKKLEAFLGRNLAEFELFNRAVLNHGVAWTDTLSWPGGTGPGLAVDVSASGYELDGGQYVLATIHERERPVDDGPPPSGDGQRRLHERTDGTVPEGRPQPHGAHHPDAIDAHAVAGGDP